MNSASPVDLSVVPDLTMRAPAGPDDDGESPTVGGLAGLVRKIAVRPELWWHLVRFDGEPVPVEAGTGAAVWLRGWPPGRRAAPESQVVTVLAGELHERTITGRGVAARELRANRLRVYGAGHPRELLNPGPAYAISLHAAIR